jgi:hypothetical protein
MNFPRLKRKQVMDFTMLYDANGESIGWEHQGLITLFSEYEYAYEFYCKALENNLKIRVIHGQNKP